MIPTECLRNLWGTPKEQEFKCQPKLSEMAPQTLNNDSPKHPNVPLLKSKEQLFDVPRQKSENVPKQGGCQRDPKGSIKNHTTMVKNAPESNTWKSGPT